MEGCLIDGVQPAVADQQHPGRLAQHILHACHMVCRHVRHKIRLIGLDQGLWLHVRRLAGVHVLASNIDGVNMSSTCMSSKNRVLWCCLLCFATIPAVTCAAVAEYTIFIVCSKQCDHAVPGAM
jgi:hypothetical protein